MRYGSELCGHIFTTQVFAIAGGHVEVFTEPFECFYPSIFATIPRFRGIFAGAFVVYDQTCRAQNGPFVTGIAIGLSRFPIAFKKKLFSFSNLGSKKIS